jgi:hypothetical protein
VNLRALELTFYLQIGMSGLEFVGLVIFFWDKTGAVYRAEHARENEDAGTAGAGTREAMKSKVTWLCALFFFAYMGVEGKLQVACISCHINACLC